MQTHLGRDLFQGQALAQHKFNSELSSISSLSRRYSGCSGPPGLSHPECNPMSLQVTGQKLHKQLIKTLKGRKVLLSHQNTVEKLAYGGGVKYTA